MNYYIQGSPDRAKEIKAAFEKLGFDPAGWDCDGAHSVYFTVPGDNKVKSLHISIGKIIMTHHDYQELELPTKPNFKVGDLIARIDDEGDVETEKIVCFIRNKVLLVDVDGCFTEYPKTELSNFHLWTIKDAKDGDVLATDNGWTCIFKAFDGYVFSSYCFMDSQKWFCESGSEVHTLDSRINGNIHPATKEQRELLFKKMKEAGYQWNEEKKELHKIKHYDISSFYAGMPVLVRIRDEHKWCYVLFSHRYIHQGILRFHAGGAAWLQCIPFNEDTKHLLGTTDMCDEQYINW